MVQSESNRPFALTLYLAALYESGNRTHTPLLIFTTRYRKFIFLPTHEEEHQPFERNPLLLHQPIYFRIY
jgi:hypothetical protein